MEARPAARWSAPRRPATSAIYPITCLTIPTAWYQPTHQTTIHHPFIIDVPTKNKTNKYKVNIKAISNFKQIFIDSKTSRNLPFLALMPGYAMSRGIRPLYAMPSPIATTPRQPAVLSKRFLSLLDIIVTSPLTTLKYQLSLRPEPETYKSSSRHLFTLVILYPRDFLQTL